MESDLSKIDWSLVNSFLTVAETGSLSAAARLRGASQPTLGRHIRDLEQQLGVQLFRRQPRGLELTDAGRLLISPAERMRDAMRDIHLFAAGRESGLQGTVRVTASEMMAHHVLPPIIAAIRIQLPEVSVELVPTDSSENLLYREADIAVRMYQPEQLDVVARRLGQVPLGIFAAKRYLNRRGRPESIAELADHDLVGYDRNELILRGMQEAGLDIRREQFTTRCDNQTTYWELVRAGCGIGFGQRLIGLRDPDVEEIEFGFPLPSLPVWLATHQGIRQTPRVRRVWDMLAEGLAPVVS